MTFANCSIKVDLRNISQALNDIVDGHLTYCGRILLYEGLQETGLGFRIFLFNEEIRTSP